MSRNTVIYKCYDDYTTTKSTWESLVEFIPKDKIIYEPFYCDGKSGEILTELGYDVIHKNEDFFEFYDKYEYDVIVSNPPYSLKKQIFRKLKEIDKPFIMIVPIDTINTQYFKKLFKGDIQLIISDKRINFDKITNGEIDPNNRACPFHCYFVCYKINLEKDIVWL
jgi:hypothetical protein